MSDLSQPTRQSKKSIVLYLFNNIRGLILLLLYVFFGMSSWSNFFVSVGITIVLTTLSLVSPVLKYLFFTFHIESEELILNKGWLFKERKAIPLDRIQSINISQGVVQRLLKVVALEIETAGSKAKELEIPALDRPFAEALKLTLNRKRKSLIDNEDNGGSLNNENLEPDELSHKANEEVLLELSLWDLFKVGLTQNHLKSGGVAIALVFGFWYKIKDIVERFYGDPFENWDTDLKTAVEQGKDDLTAVGLMIVIGLVLFTIVSIIISIVIAMTSFYNYKLIKTDEHLEITMGLLKKHEIKVPLSKIQIIQFYSNPLRRLLNYQTAHIYQAQSDGNKSKVIQVPACKTVHRQLLQASIYEQAVSESIKTLQANPWSYLRLNSYILSCVFIPIIVAAVYFKVYALVAAVLLIWSFCAYAAYKRGLKAQVATDGNYLIFKKGWVFPSKIITPIFKTQAIEKWRSIFIIRRGEAHIQHHTAAGSRTIKYLQNDELDALQQIINYKVISSQKAWM